LGAPIWTVISLPTCGRARLQAIQREAHLRRCCGLRSTRSHISLGREFAGLVSGDNMLIPAGSLDQRPVQAAPDSGLICRGEPLAQPLTIAGNVRMSLAVQSDCADTDFIAKLVDLLPDGRAMLPTDGITRALFRDPSGEPRPLSPDRVERLAIDLGHPRRHQCDSSRRGDAVVCRPAGITIGLGGRQPGAVALLTEKLREGALIQIKASMVASRIICHSRDRTYTAVFPAFLPDDKRS
jgi:hypothetical protein